jgi:hypothetical protein
VGKIKEKLRKFAAIKPLKPKLDLIQINFQPASLEMTIKTPHNIHKADAKQLYEKTLLILT